jgi:signal transduction histidine kinase
MSVSNLSGRSAVYCSATKILEEYERFLHELGSDLHDGPASLVSFALLRLEGIESGANSSDIGVVRSALQDASRDIRRISSGLLLENYEQQNLAECVSGTIRHHEITTGTVVDAKADNLPVSCPPSVRICLCRFIQEGLANAFRHAGGKGQSVVIEGTDTGISVQVSDHGPGITTTSDTDSTARLGLTGLRRRIESLHGTFAVSSNSGIGTTLSAWLPLK